MLKVSGPALPRTPKNRRHSYSGQPSCLAVTPYTVCIKSLDTLDWGHDFHCLKDIIAYQNHITHCFTLFEATVYMVWMSNEEWISKVSKWSGGTKTSLLGPNTHLMFPDMGYIAIGKKSKNLQNCNITEEGKNFLPFNINHKNITNTTKFCPK